MSKMSTKSQSSKSSCESSKPARGNVAPNSKLACIGVLTSGGDSQGMNCVLYGLLAGAFKQTEVYLIRDGYQGLVTGGPKLIEKGDRDKMARFLSQGGTVIGSSRCQEFRTEEGRKKAARNLLQRNINAIVVCGGDGSLTGANFLRQEWPGIVSKEKGQSVSSKLNLVGIIGSIDNDFMGSDMTVGTDSALFRIQEAIDTLRTTAASHGRAMVVEVMGRNCGYLALNSALATEATYVFMPECPHSSTGDWQNKLKTRINFERSCEQLFHFVIVAEGACSKDGEPIRATAIRDYLDKGLGLDARVIVLAHTQRGGTTSAFDRLMSVQMGIDAFHVIRSQSESEKVSEAVVLTLNEGQMRVKPLMECVQETTKLNNLMKQRKYDQVLAMRGHNFAQTWNNFLELMSNSQVKGDQRDSGPLWAVAHIGEPVAGMNAVLYAVVRTAWAHNIRVIGARNGIEGLQSGNFEQMTWQTVSGLTAPAGSYLGCRGVNAKGASEEMSARTIIDQLNRQKVSCLCLVGDQKAFQLAKLLRSSKVKAKVCLIPACLRPDGELAPVHCKLGFDSVLNRTCKLLSGLAEQGTQQLILVRLNLAIATSDFVQPSLFGMANAASNVYPSSKAHFRSSNVDSSQVEQDANSLKGEMATSGRNQLVLIHESVFCQVAERYLSVFGSAATSMVDISALQSPSKTTPFDRKLGVKLGMRCAQFFKEEGNTSTVLLSAQTFDFVAI